MEYTDVRLNTMLKTLWFRDASVRGNLELESKISKNISYTHFYLIEKVIF